MAMADIIAAHKEVEWEGSTGQVFCECGIKLCALSASIQTQYRKLYAHAADELAKAGYGKLEAA